VLVQKDCCPCTATGAQIAIRKDQSAAHSETLATKCRGMTCGQAISSDPSCYAKPACVRGLCAVGPDTRE